MREGARILRPLSSSMVFTFLSVKCMSEPSCRCAARRCVPLNSSSAFFWMYSQSAGLPEAALLAMKGISKTSDLVNRPAW